MDTFVEIGMKDATEIVADATEVSMRPGAIAFERIKPLLLRFLGRKFIQPWTRPLMSPRARFT